MNKYLGAAIALFCLAISVPVYSQETFPVNGVADNRQGIYAFTNAMIVKDAAAAPSSGTLLIKEGKIRKSGRGLLDNK